MAAAITSSTVPGRQLVISRSADPALVGERTPIGDADRFSRGPRRGAAAARSPRPGAVLAEPRVHARDASPHPSDLRARGGVGRVSGERARGAMLLPFRSLQLFARVARGELLVSGNRCRNRGESPKGPPRARRGWKKTRFFDRPRRRRGRAWGCEDAPQAHERLEHERHELLVALAPPASSARAEQDQAAVDGVRAKSKRFPRRSHDRGARPRARPLEPVFSGRAIAPGRRPARCVPIDPTDRRGSTPSGLVRVAAPAALSASPRACTGSPPRTSGNRATPLPRYFSCPAATPALHPPPRGRARPAPPTVPGPTRRAREHRDPRSASLHRPRTSRGRGARTVRSARRGDPAPPFSRSAETRSARGAS